MTEPVEAASLAPLGDDVMDALVEFHTVYGCPMRPAPVAQPDEYALRLDLLREEWEEYVHAVAQKDVVEVADALADMVYVIFGTALSYGIDLPAVLAEVHRSNMSKVGDDGKPVYREDGKVMKGPNFSRPDIAAVLQAQPKASASPCPGCEGGWGFADNAHTRDNRCQYDTQRAARDRAGDERG